MPRAILVSSFIEAMNPRLGVGVASAANPARPSPITPIRLSVVSTGTAGSSPVLPSMRFSPKTRCTRPSCISNTRTMVTLSTAVCAAELTMGVTPYSHRSIGAPGASATSRAYRAISPSAFTTTHSTRACTGACIPLVTRTRMAVGSPGRT